MGLLFERKTSDRVIVDVPASKMIPVPQFAYFLVAWLVGDSWDCGRY